MKTTKAIVKVKSYLAKTNADSETIEAFNQISRDMLELYANNKAQQMHIQLLEKHLERIGA